MFDRPLLLLNPVAGPWWRRRWIRPVIEFWKRQAPAVKVQETPGPGRTTELVRRAVDAGHTLIICAGGDGTANEAINGLAGTSIPLAMLPLGTGNALAREAGLSSHPLLTCEQILTGRPVRIPLGEAGGRYFALAAGTGFDAHVLHSVSRRAIRLAGSLAYLVTATVAVSSYPYPRIVFLADGVRIEGTSGVIFKARISIGPIDLMPTASLQDSMFYLLVCTARTPSAYLAYGAALLCGQHLRLRTSRVVKARSIHAEADRKVPVHLDGELIEQLPATFTLGAATVSLVYAQK